MKLSEAMREKMLLSFELSAKDRKRYGKPAGNH